LRDRAEALKQFVVQAAMDANSLDEIERGLLKQFLTIGNHAMNATLSLQGTGDLAQLPQFGVKMGRFSGFLWS
jgi:hypothetical protein